MTEERYAPAGAIWVCAACGKKSKDRYGDETSSWDESCMLNAVLCHEVLGPDGWRKFEKTNAAKRCASQTRATALNRSTETEEK